MRLIQNLASWSTPIAYLGVAILSFHFALCCPYQRLRSIFLLIFFYFALLSFLASTKLPLAVLASLWAQSMALNMVHIFSISFLEDIPAPWAGKTKFFSLKSICSTYRLWANPQLLQEVTDLSDKSDKKEGRLVFLFLRLSKLFMYYYMHTLVLPIFYQETLEKILPSDVSQPALLSRLGLGVTPREIVMRSYMAVSWVWESMVFLDGANSILSLVFVGSGFDQPGDWPQLFGSLCEARGLRNFWGRFWHKLAMRPYRNYGLTISRNLIRHVCVKSFEKEASDVVVAFVVFFLSGMSHAVVSWRLGMRDWLDLKWFLLNFAACFVERLVLSLIRSIAAKYGVEKDLKTIERSWLGKTVAYGWVFGFFFWSVPLWVYPRYERSFRQAVTKARQ